MDVVHSVLKYFVLLEFILLFAAPFAVAAEQTKSNRGNENLPVLIEADRMESEQGKDTVVVFSGRVEAKQGDLIIRSDTMRVYYAKVNEVKQGSDSATKKQDGAAGSQKIQKFIATGNVQVIQENWIGTSNSMEYVDDERKVVLIGNAKVVRDSNMVVGETITHYIDEGKSVAQRGPGEGQRVKAVFYPSSKQDDKGNATVNKQGRGGP